MSTIWILVANQAEAQIYSAKYLHGDIKLLTALTHEEGAAHPRDLVSDRPGRVHDRTGSGRHSMEPDTRIREEHRRRFVKELVVRLEAARSKGEFEQLVLIAAPAVLGEIRKTLTGGLAKAVVKEISKDVAGQDPARIRAQLGRQQG